jgi:hypothetical protein
MRFCPVPIHPSLPFDPFSINLASCSNIILPDKMSIMQTVQSNKTSVFNTVRFYVPQNAQNEVRYVPYCDAEEESDK